MWAIEDSPGPKAAYQGGGIILLPAILLLINQFSSLTLYEDHGIITKFT